MSIRIDGIYVRGEAKLRKDPLRVQCRVTHEDNHD